MRQPLIYIEDRIVDLDPRTNMALTYQINEIGDAKDRRTTGTNRAKALFTENNNELFGYANVVQSLSDVPKRIIPVRFDNGDDIYYGNLYIDKANDGYDIQFITGSNGLFSAIEGKKLSDLITLSEYDTTWGTPFMLTYYGATTSPTFLINDDGTLPTGTRVVNLQKQYYSLYVRDIFQKIIQEAGYTFEGSLFTDELYNDLVLPFTNEKPKKDSDLKVEAFVSADYNFTVNSNTKEPVLFDDDSVLGVDVWSQWFITPSLTYFHPLSAGDSKLELFLDIKLNVVNPNSGWFPIRVVLMKQNVVTGAIQTESIIGEYYQAWNGQRKQIKYSGDIIKQSSDNYFIAVWSTQQTGTGTIYENSYVKITPNEDAAYGDFWSFRQNMPDITQKDFLKSIMQLTGAIVDTDPLTMKARFELFETITSEASKANAVNIDKYLSGKPKEIDYHPDGVSQKNWLRFKKDERVTEFYGDSFFTVGDETLAKESTLLTLPFAAAMKVISLNGLDVYQILRQFNGSDVTPQPRLLVHRSETGLSPVITFADGGTVGTDSEYHYGSFDDVDFKALLNRYFTNRIEVLNDYRKVTETAFFDANFINQLDLFTPVYSHIYSSYFIINKIPSYQSGKPCNIELIRT